MPVSPLMASSELLLPPDAESPSDTEPSFSSFGPLLISLLESARDAPTEKSLSHPWRTKVTAVRLQRVVSEEEDMGIEGRQLGHFKEDLSGKRRKERFLAMGRFHVL